MLDFASQLAKKFKWKLMLIRAAHKASLNSQTNRYLGYFSRLYQYLYLYREHGFQPSEVIKFGLINSHKEIEKKYVSKRHLVLRQNVLNPQSFQALTEDKSLFYSFCMQMNIPAPKLFGFFIKESPGFKWGGGALSGEVSWKDFFEKACPEEFVIKASIGVYGDGIYFVDKTTDFCGSELFRKLNSHPKFNMFIVQECLKNHPTIMEINPKRGLQTVRVVTYIDSKNNVHIVHAFFKVIVGENRVDNHKNGLTGNLICDVEISTGLLKKPISLTQCGPHSVTKHPDTGKELEGLSVPFWHEMCELAKDTAIRFLPMRTIGWDIAVTTDGIRIIEGNAHWDPPMFGNLGKTELVFQDG